MKKHLVIAATTLMLSSPAFAGDGGQAVADAAQAGGKSWGQSVSSYVRSGGNLGQIVKTLNGN